MALNLNLNNGIKWSVAKPSTPQVGDCYTDLKTGDCYTWTGTAWAKITDSKMIPSAALLTPTEDQLEKHPSLKQAWEEYLVIRRLLGI